MTWEEFSKKCQDLTVLAGEMKKPHAYPFTLLRSETWPDGTPKSWRCLGFDQVDPERYQDVIAACEYMIAMP